jgi:hypothetical protein
MSEQDKEAQKRLDALRNNDPNFTFSQQYDFDMKKERRQEKQVKKKSKQVSLNGPLQSHCEDVSRGTHHSNSEDGGEMILGMRVSQVLGEFPFLLLAGDSPPPSSSSSSSPPPEHINTSVLKESDYVFSFRQILYDVLYERNPRINMTPFCTVVDYWDSINDFLNNHILPLDTAESTLIWGKLDLDVAQESEAGLRRYRRVNDHVALITQEFEQNWYV